MMQALFKNLQVVNVAHKITSCHKEMKKSDLRKFNIVDDNNKLGVSISPGLAFL